MTAQSKGRNFTTWYEHSTQSSGAPRSRSGFYRAHREYGRVSLGRVAKRRYRAGAAGFLSEAQGGEPGFTKEACRNPEARVRGTGSAGKIGAREAGGDGGAGRKKPPAISSQRSARDKCAELEKMVETILLKVFTLENSDFSVSGERIGLSTASL